MTDSFVLNKSPSLLAASLLGWAALTAVALFPVVTFSKTCPILNYLFVALVLLLIVQFLNVSRMLSIIFLGRDAASPAVIAPRHPAVEPRVAVLYCTCNDFLGDSLRSCINLNYGNFHSFVLDDSDDRHCMQALDGFVRQHPDRVTLVRRPTRGGHKAGNLNHALRMIAPDFEYFIVVDSDNLLPVGFITDLLPYFQLSNQIGFVSCNQAGYLKAHNVLGRSWAHSWDLQEDLVAHVKNKYGHVRFSGHNAIIKTSAWKEIGGFPEIVFEDIAFSLKARAAGFGGIFVRDYCVREAVPPDMAAMQRKLARHTVGGCQFMVQFYPAFVFEKNVSWVEKLDVLFGVFATAFQWPALFCLTALLFDVFQRVFVLWHPAGNDPAWLLRSRIESLMILMVTLLSLCFLLSTVLSRKNRAHDKMSPFAFIVWQTYLYVASLPKFLINIFFAAPAARLYDWIPSGDTAASRCGTPASRELAECLLGAIIVVVGVSLKSPGAILVGTSSLATLVSCRIGKAMPALAYATFFCATAVGFQVVLRTLSGGNLP